MLFHFMPYTLKRWTANIITGRHLTHAYERLRNVNLIWANMHLI